MRHCGPATDDVTRRPGEKQRPDDEQYLAEDAQCNDMVSVRLGAL